MTSSLEEKANKDNLTGVANRDGFEESFSLEIKRARENNLPLSLMLFDIDHFKSVNDTYGHQAGDNILIEIASIVSNNIKSNDIFARWGGEEFILLMPNTPIEGAFSLSEKLRAMVEAHHFSYTDSITASFGVAEFQADDNKTSLFQKADDALYLAKKNGRNRVEKSI